MIRPPTASRSVALASLWVIGLGPVATPTAAQLPNQAFEVVPETTRATVGDPVWLRFRVRLDERDLLYDTVPKPMSPLPEGVRILAVDKLRRGADRIYTGRARVAFYRTGRQPTPVFGLPFMRAVKGVTRAVLASDSAFVEIDPVAPAGNPSLKDIKEIERQRGPDPRLVPGALVAVAVVLTVGWLSRRGRSAPTERPHPPGAPAPVLGPYEIALARLVEIQRERWPARGAVDRHYAAVADTLRRYLEAAHGVPALERTTGELIPSLPAALAHRGLGERCAAWLGEADLVKFARVSRDSHAVERFTREARALLDEWHAGTAGLSGE